jgi:hypothetical protein
MAHARTDLIFPKWQRELFETIVSLENLEMSDGKGIIFPLQFMGNVIPPTRPRGSNSWRPWLMPVNTIRMRQACQRSRDQTQIAKGQSER